MQLLYSNKSLQYINHLKSGPSRFLVLLACNRSCPPSSPISCSILQFISSAAPLWYVSSSTFCPFHNHQLSARQEQPVVPLNCTISTEIRLCLSLKNSLLVTITIFICCCLQRRITQKKSNLFKWHFIVTRYRQF